jgi:hypothetical protein
MRFVWVVVGFLILFFVLTGPVVARLARTRTDCASSVVLVKGPRGQTLECVCIEGTLATCFTPGP